MTQQLVLNEKILRFLTGEEHCFNQQKYFQDNKLNITMGTVQPSASIYNGNFNHKNWLVAGKSRKTIPGQPTLVQIQQTQIMADEYIIRLNYPQTFSRQSFIYQKRASSNSSCLVNIFSAQLLTQKNQLSGANEIVRIRTERIPWRLSQAKSLQLQQGLYILEHALRGYAQIFQHFAQPIFVNDNMIGMNIFGTVRVWINPNFSKNQTLSYHKTVNLPGMIQSIILAIERHMQSLTFPQQIRSDILNSYGLSLASIKVSNYLLKSKEDKKRIGLNILNKIYQNKQKCVSPVSNLNLPPEKTKSSIKIYDNKDQEIFNSRISRFKQLSRISYGQKELNNYQSLNRNFNQPLTSPYKSPDRLLQQEYSRLRSNSIGKKRKDQKMYLSKAIQVPLNYSRGCYQSNQLIQNIHKKYTQNIKSIKNRNSTQQSQLFNSKKNIQSQIQVDNQNRPFKNNSFQIYESKYQKLNKVKQNSSSQQSYPYAQKNRTLGNYARSPQGYGKNTKSTLFYDLQPTHKKNPQQDFFGHLNNSNANISRQKKFEHRSPLQLRSSYKVQSKGQEKMKDNFIIFEVKLQKTGQIKRDKTSPIKKSKALNEVENMDKNLRRNIKKSPEKPNWVQALQRKN